MLRITSEAGGLLIGRHGQTLDALEYLINRIVGRQDEQGGRILVDAEGYRERRSQRASRDGESGSPRGCTRRRARRA